MSSAIGCSFWSTQLNFTAPISARHFCLLGNNRYAAPPTNGNCNNDHATGFSCNDCWSWDGNQRRDCDFRKGRGLEMGTLPPTSGYDEINCPIGFEQYTDVSYLDLACPSGSVLVLEILALDEATNSSTTPLSQYDFAVVTTRGVVREFVTQQCLTGTGGRACGEDTLTMLAYEQDGHCRLAFHSGTGYKIQCDNGLQEASSHYGDRQECFEKNGFSCLEVMQLTASSDSEVGTVLNGNGIDSNLSLLCGLDEAQGLVNPMAWLVGAASILFSLLPGFSYWRKGNISPAFLVGLLSEAMKNGLVMVSIISVDWRCLQYNGLINTTGSHIIFLPYSLIAFSLADTILALIAFVSRWDQDLDDTFDKHKWVAEDTNFMRRGMTIITIVIFGGIGGFLQLVLLLEGVADNPANAGSIGMSSWASWVFIISASLGGLFATVLILIGVYTGRMRLAWKTYKILVGDIPGLVSAVDLAVVLLVGWLGEAFADFIHAILYMRPMPKVKKESTAVQEPEAEGEATKGQ